MGTSFYIYNSVDQKKTKIGHRVNGNFFWEIDFDELLEKINKGYIIYREDSDGIISFKNFVLYNINGCRHVTEKEFNEWERNNPNECFPANIKNNYSF